MTQSSAIRVPTRSQRSSQPPGQRSDFRGFAGCAWNPVSNGQHTICRKGTNQPREQMATSYPGDQGKTAIKHPDTSVPTDVLHAAYVAVLAALARHEPDALLRAARMLSDEGSSLSSEPRLGPAAELAHAWLVFTGRGADVVEPPPERVFGFAFPATMTFELVGRGTAKSVARRAMRALRAVQAEDEPLGAVAGPHPTYPELLNVTIWAGSYLKNGDDRLVLELATDDDEAETS